MKTFFLSSVFALTLITGFMPSFVTAQDTPSPAPPDYNLLAPIPLDSSGAPTPTVNAGSYIPGIIKLAIALASGLAVIRIIIGGIKYMTTDAFEGKSEAKNTIRDALVGLLLAISAYVILNTVNPDLVKINLSLERLETGKAFDTTLGAATPGSGIPCSGCVPMDQNVVPQKAVGAGCMAPGPCVVSPELASKLTELAKRLTDVGIIWQVSEMSPAKVTHIDPCHQVGTCVDAISNTGDYNLLGFLTAIEAVVGSKFEYETCNKTRLNYLKNSTTLAKFKDRFKCETTSIGEAAHIAL